MRRLTENDLPPLRALRVFAVLAKSNRYSDAATQLGVTTSAVSQQIRVLEEWIGTELLDRKTRQPKLSPVGLTLFDGIAAPLARLDATCGSIRRANDQQRIVVSAPSAYVQYRLIPALQLFWQDHRGIDVEIRIAERFDAPFEDGVVDLAIRFLHDHEAATPLGMRGWRAVCHRSYFEILEKPESILDISKGNLLHEEVFNFWPQAFREAEVEVPDEIVFRGLGDASHVMTAVLAGDAIALLPSELAVRLIREGVLVSPFRVAIEPRSAYFAIDQAANRKASTQLLIDQLAGIH